MTDECSICGRADVAIGNHTLLDTSGGTMIHTCQECWDDISTPLCHLCGDRCNPSKSRGIYSQDFAEFDEGEVPPTYTVCDTCRVDLINGDVTEVPR